MIKLICENCKKEFERKPSDVKDSKNHFCSSSCAATHNNKAKPEGQRDSKLERWLKPRLRSENKDLEFHFNHKKFKFILNF